MSSADISLFSYGTLQQNDVQMETFGRLLSGEPDALCGYRRGMIRITDPKVLAASGEERHPIVEPSADPADLVSGMVFEITATELDAADAYETSDYRRVELGLKSGRKAWVYVKA